MARYTIRMETVRSMESKQQQEIKVILARTMLWGSFMRESDERILTARRMKENEVMKMVITTTPMKAFVALARATSN